jgi:hypothetical protein
MLPTLCKPSLTDPITVINEEFPAKPTITHVASQKTDPLPNSPYANPELNLFKRNYLSSPANISLQLILQALNPKLTR